MKQFCYYNSQWVGKGLWRSSFWPNLAWF